MVKSDPQTTDDAVFKALGNAERRFLLDALRDGEQTTGDLCQALPRLNRCTVMQHLGVLEKSGLVISSKRGRQRWYALDVAPIQRIYNRWISDFAAPSAQMLTSLKDDLESV